MTSDAQENIDIFDSSSNKEKSKYLKIQIDRLIPQYLHYCTNEETSDFINGLVNDYMSPSKKFTKIYK